MSDITLYFDSLREIEEAQIFIAENVDELGKELSQNYWSVSIRSDLASVITPAHLLGFLDRVLKTERSNW